MKITTSSPMPNPLKKSSIRYNADELLEMQLQSTPERWGWASQLPLSMSSISPR